MKSLDRAYEIFGKLGFHPSLGLAWWLTYGYNPKGGNKKVAYIDKNDEIRFGRKVIYYKIKEADDRKIGRWIRRGLIPKPGTI